MKKKLLVCRECREGKAVVDNGANPIKMDVEIDWPEADCEDCLEEDCSECGEFEIDLEDL